MAKPDISLEEAIKKTKEAGFTLDYPTGETVIGLNLFELNKDIEQSKSQIQNIHWIFAVVIVALLVTVFVMLADYFQFSSQAYRDFNETIKNEKVDQSDIKSIKSDIELIKQNLQIKNKGK